MRVKGLISYDGRKFHGFQPLNCEGKTTHKTVISALESLLKAHHIHTKIIGSGRTDRDVHASGQVIAFDVPHYWTDLKKLKKTLNQRLEGIQIRHLTPVASDFHPQFHAKKRMYRYLITTKQPSIFAQDYITYVNTPIDLALLQKALQCFEGTHDFEYFHKIGSDKRTTIRTIFRTKLYVHKGVIVLCFEGNGFLRSQIRLMVGMILAVVNHKRTIEDLKDQLAKKSYFFKRPAPPNGLYLAKVTYT